MKNIAILTLMIFVYTQFALAETYEQSLTAWNVAPDMERNLIQIRKPALQGGHLFVAGTEESYIQICRAFGINANSASVELNSDLYFGQIAGTYKYPVQNNTGLFELQTGPTARPIERLNCLFNRPLSEIKEFQTPLKTRVHTYQPYMRQFANKYGAVFSNLTYVYEY